MLHDPLVEQPLICKRLWGLELDKTVKAYVASEICKYDYDEIAQNVGINRHDVSTYIVMGEKSLRQRFKTIIQMGYKAIEGEADPKEICKKIAKNKGVICNAIYLALFIKRVIKESVKNINKAEVIKTAAIAIHLQTFPLFYALYKASMGNRSKIRATRRGERWHVSIPSAVYIIYVILKAYMDNPVSFFYNDMEMAQIEETIRRLARKNVRKLLSTREDAKIARELAILAIKTVFPTGLFSRI